MGKKKMRKEHPGILCEFYETLLEGDPRLKPEELVFNSDAMVEEGVSEANDP